MSSASSAENPEVPSRIVVLGASNVSLGWPRLVQLISTFGPGPVEIYTAHGMGRSYCGERSGFVFHQLPGILSSSLWDNLPSASTTTRPPSVLITDLGNDLVYGSSPTEVCAAAEQCIDRLRRWDSRCQIAVSRPPVESVHKVGWLRFLLCRTLLFPKCPLSRIQAIQATAELDELIVAMGRDREVTIEKPDPEHYWIDPIHVRRRNQHAAFASLTACWALADPRCSKSGSDSRSTARPAALHSWVLGRGRTVPQPSVKCDGLNVFAY